MNTQKFIYEKKNKITQIAAKHGAVNIRLFGSVVHGEDSPQSDIDFLVDIKEPTTPWFPAGLIIDLKEILGRDIDVVTEKALNPLIRDNVLKEAKPL